MKKIDKLRFGTAGIPVSTKGDTIQGIKDVRKLGLDSFEMEFVRGVNIKEEKTPEIRKVAKESDVVLTAHSPYWINLNSDDKKKFHASINYVTSSAKILSLCGGHSVCFHAGYYMKQEPRKVYDNIKIGIKKITDIVKEFDKDIWISPEISGKKAQFGDVDELISLSQEFDQVMPCIDFSHLMARECGSFNTLEEFGKVLEQIETKLGKDYLGRMHIHVAGIEYGEKGEKHHLILENSKFNYKDLLKALKEFKVKGVVTCESPNIEADALMMKKYYENIKL